MWKFLSKNKQVAAMLGFLGVAASLVLIIATRSSGYSVVENFIAESDDISSDPFIFSCNSLPSNDRFMPSIGNGHVATNVFSDTVYLNGLYNGPKGESRRARIPSWANVRLNYTLHPRLQSPVFSLDTKRGVFVVKIDREKSVVRQIIYAHKFFTRAIINQIEISSKPHVDVTFIHHQIWVILKLMPGEDSKDITFEEPTAETLEGRHVWSSCGKTRVSEDVKYQPVPAEVCAYWTSVPDHLVVPQHGNRIFTFAMTVDKNQTVAKREMIKVLQEKGENLLKIHVEEWQKMHDQAGIHIEGGLKLSKIVNGIWYYYLSSLPSEKSYQTLDRFYGLSPTGLARGGTFEDYEGHNFWDTEIWIFPSILLLYPQYAKQLLQYRLETAYAAADLAKTSGNKGYRFPWESAFTGREVTQPCCPEVAEFEQHISGCIAFAARQYLATTRDETWLKNGGCSLVTNIADFWASRTTMNYTTGFYDIPHVMGPDEDHSNVSNSVFTNVVAGFSLYLAQYVACLCKSYYISKDPDHWADIAWSLALPYDKDLDYHPQFSGYTRPNKIKQADAVLLGYPLQYPMKESSRSNDLKYYESVTRGSGPAMTWSMHTIGHLQLEDNLRAAVLFNKSYGEYVKEPFKIWSEYRRPNVGAVNFLTGMGGFLQALIFGYAGVSIHLDKLVIKKPQLPPEATEFKIRGIKYLGADLTLEIEVEKTTLTVTSIDPEWPLEINTGKNDITLRSEMKIALSGDGPFTIRSNQWQDCKLPADVIGHHYLRHGDKS